MCIGSVCCPDVLQALLPYIRSSTHLWIDLAWSTIFFAKMICVRIVYAVLAILYLYVCIESAFKDQHLLEVLSHSFFSQAKGSDS